MVAQSQCDAGAWTLVVLPDTAACFPEHVDVLERQIEWVLDQKEQRNIAFVAHTGEITQDNSDEQWRRCRGLLGRFDGVLPYTLVSGMHDHSPRKFCPVQRLSRLSEHFSEQQMRQLPGFGGLYEEGCFENSYHRFRAGGRDWLVLALEWTPRDEVLDWADEVMTQHAGHACIIVTPTQLESDGGRLDRCEAPGRVFDTKKGEEGPLPPGRNDGQQLWEKLAVRHTNLRLILSGQRTGSGAALRSSSGPAGSVVHEILSCFRTWPRGGQGYLRLLEFQSDRRTVQVKTYSPLLNRYRREPPYEFSLHLDRVPEERPWPRPVSLPSADDTAKSVCEAALSSIWRNEPELRLPRLRAPSVARDRDVICFVGVNLSGRVVKLARSARLCGYRPVFIRCAGNWEGQNAHLDEFEEIYLADSHAELFAALDRFAPLVYHVVHQTLNLPRVVMAPFLFDPDRVVVDFYDPLHPSVNPQRFAAENKLYTRTVNAYRLQRFAYNNARGICTRLMAPRLTKSHRAGFEQTRIYYPEPLWRTQVPDTTKLSATDGKLHVVFAGNFQPPPEPEPDFAGFMWLAERCEAFDIHLHLHVSHNREAKNFRRYQQLAEHSPNFHIEPFLPMEAYIDTIARYDVGITPMVPDDPRALWNTNRALYPRPNWGSKLADYADAGLYVVASHKHWNMARMLAHYGLGEAPPNETLLSEAYWADLLPRCDRARRALSNLHSRLSVEQQARRLGAFYRQIDRLATDSEASANAKHPRRIPLGSDV